MGYNSTEYENLGNDADELIHNDPAELKQKKRNPAYQEIVTNLDDIVTRRKKIATKAFHFMTVANIVTGTGSLGVAYTLPAIGVPLMVTNIAVLITNECIRRKSSEKFALADWAIEICKNDNETDQEKNDAACKHLHSVERYIRHFEKSRNILWNISKFGMENLGLPGKVLGKGLELGLKALESYEFFKNYLGTEKEAPSHGMRKNLYLLEENLDFSHPASDSLTEKYAHKLLPDKLARVVIKPLSYS
jgi:hypothetical protein